jgi:hypothetical protein
MESTNAFSGEEQARKLERVFQIFACAPEDWVMACGPGEASGDMEKNDAVST